MAKIRACVCLLVCLQNVKVSEILCTPPSTSFFPSMSKDTVAGGIPSFAVHTLSVAVSSVHGSTLWSHKWRAYRQPPGGALCSLHVCSARHTGEMLPWQVFIWLQNTFTQNSQCYHPWCSLNQHGFDKLSLLMGGEEELRRLFWCRAIILSGQKLSALRWRPCSNPWIKLAFLFSFGLFTHSSSSVVPLQSCSVWVHLNVHGMQSSHFFKGTGKCSGLWTLTADVGKGR